ncbi:MAG: SDR family oxidoreductase, partial [Alphaproteobacteria bacterium]|nr:SDR family oxidoreductase [Alphaproteobacteria bacterium]
CRGTLGQAFARACVARGLPHAMVGRPDCDIAAPGTIAATLAAHRPWAVINAAGFVDVDRAETTPDLCRRENVTGARRLAEACARAGLPLLSFSSDLVFDGGKGLAYVETDRPAPLGVYGASKAEAERAVLDVLPDALMVRTSAFFGPWDRHNFAAHALAALERGETVRAACDAIVSPTYVPDLADACLDLLIDGETGVWHLASQGAASWADLVGMIAERAGYPACRVVAAPGRSLGWLARRPANSALISRRGWIMPTLDHALGRFFEARPGATTMGPLGCHCPDLD